MRIVVVPEFDDPGVPFECRLDDAALNTAAETVDHANLEQPARRERVEVEP